MKFGLDDEGNKDLNVKEMTTDKRGSRESRGLDETLAVKIITHSHCPLLLREQWPFSMTLITLLLHVNHTSDLILMLKT